MHATLLAAADSFSIFGVEAGVPLAAVLLVIGLVLVMAEVFIPSGGALSITATLAVGGSVVSAFQDSVLTGFLFIIGVMLLIPLVLAVSFRFFPHTPIGRLMITAPPVQGGTVGSGTGVDANSAASLVVQSDLRPSGKADIAGETRTVVNQAGDHLEVGRRVQVVEVEGARILVRAI